MEEPVWGQAEVASEFVQTAPRYGAPASERTEVRILYDDRAIYVGMRMYDGSADSIAMPLARRDALGINSDWAGVWIDSYFDQRTAFGFAVNPSGVKRDLLYFDDVRADVTWDAVWTVATHVDSLGWTAEFRIPLSQLRFSRDAGPEREHVFGINFSREIARKGETASWAALPPSADRVVSRFGTLRGLHELSRPRQLEVLAYTVGRLTRAPEERENPLYRANDLYATLGADIKYGFTSSLTLTAALNPDFGQVEADPSEVNLTAFETFLVDRRPFFTEGAETLRFGLGIGDQLFYSRRIGRAPQRMLGNSGGFVDVPDAAPILGAVKLSGKAADGWSVGLLSALSGPLQATVSDSAGALSVEPVEPLTNYLIARVTRDFAAGGSALGGIITATNRRIHDERLAFLNSGSYTGGVDGRHRFANGMYEASGWVLGSHIRGSETAIERVQVAPARYLQRPDARHVEYDPARTSLSGWAASATVRSVGGGDLTSSLSILARSPGFDVNELGFQQSADIVLGIGSLRFQRARPWALFRRWGVSGALIPGWNFAAEPTQRSLVLGSDFELINFWSGYLSVQHDLGVLSPKDLRGGPAIVSPARTRAFFGFSSDPRRAARVSLTGSAVIEQETGGRHLGLRPLLSFRPSPRLDLSLEPNTIWNSVPWQYVETVRVAGEPRYVFAQLVHTTASLVARLNYNFNPELSLQLYGQPFVSVGEFGTFKEVANPRADRFLDRFQTFTAEQLRYDTDQRRYAVHLGESDEEADFVFRDPNFAIRQFRSNVVLRWEYRAGSTLFIVWGQGRSGLDPEASPDLWKDALRPFAAPATNVLLIKLNYWFDI